MIDQKHGEQYGEKVANSVEMDYFMSVRNRVSEINIIL
jgi:hypothetical protein